MSAGEIAVLVASIACLGAVAGLLVTVNRLRREIRRVDAIAEQLQRQTVPLVEDARRVVDQAATEMERVGAVLDSTESVHATVDSASKLAYRAFANPVVKVLAVRAGAATGIRRLASGPETAPRPGRSMGRNGNGNGNSNGASSGTGSRNGDGSGSGSGGRNHSRNGSRSGDGLGRDRGVYR